MKIYRRYIRCIRIFTVVLMTGIGIFSGNASADSTHDGNIVIQLNDLGTVRENVEFSVYQIAQQNDTNTEWIINEELKEKNPDVDINKDKYASEWDADAARLSYLVKKLGWTGESGVTDAEGRLVLGGLDKGMYLVIQKNAAQYGVIDPFLVAIPYQIDGVWKEQVEVKPKGKTFHNGTGNILVTKRTGFLDSELMEVVDIIPNNVVYYVGIFKDSQGTQPYGENYVRTIEMKGTAVGTACFSDLPEGTYYIFETDQYGKTILPNEIQTTGTMNWQCKIEEGYTQKVNFTDDTIQQATVGLYNVYFEMPDGYSLVGNIDITKQVLKGNQPITVQDVFYVGVFANEEEKKPLQVLQLQQNGTVRAEVALGGEKGDQPITYYLFETDEYGNKVGEAFPYVVSGEGSVIVSKDKVAKVDLINSIMTNNTNDDAEREDQNEVEKDSQTTSSKTGDDSQIMLYCILALLAAFVFCRLVARKRQG